MNGEHERALKMILDSIQTIDCGLIGDYGWASLRVSEFVQKKINIRVTVIKRKPMIGCKSDGSLGWHWGSESYYFKQISE